MAVLRFPTTQGHGPFSGVPDEDGRTEDESKVRNELAALGIDYERWTLDRVREDASADEVLAAYADEIDEMKRRGGYVTADVIDVNPQTPNLEAMLARFDKEHTHSEDEVRFILAGRGVFFLALGERVASVEVHPGDMLCVPRGTRHWFTLCEDRRIRAIRWFQDATGWTPHYTGSGVDQ
jgi:1,2-dihydroxy-3-keto-5-methylthiopentene dioxygenase